jgi:reticulon-4-interacting protein 1, mitochondrial
MANTAVKSWIHTVAGYPGTLQQSTTEVPSIPSSGHILVKVHAAALNPVDIQLMNIPLNSLPLLNKPKIAGRDFSGIVLAAAPDTAFSNGDEVLGLTMDIGNSGTLTEAAHIKVAAGAVIKKPNSLDRTKAASLPLVYLTARTIIERCKTSMNGNGNKLVVLGGSSATGIYTIQIAKKMGWTVLASCSGKNVDFVKSQGATEVIDYTTSPNAVVHAVKSFKPSAIADCVGGTDCIGLAPKFVTIVGDKTSRATMGGSILYWMNPRMTLRWLMGYLGFGNLYECISLDAKAEWLEEVTKLDPEKDVIVDSVFQFDKVKEAFERLDTGRARGKVVVEVANS